MTPFAAVLLAGGHSRRMGRDKALLPLPDGRLLWERQLDVLRELQPAEIFISGPRRDGFPADIRCLADTLPDRGPLAGVAAALEAMQTPLLVALAIDLPRMTAAFLGNLLAASSRERGAVPRRTDASGGFYEPLAAVYPRACSSLAHAQLHGDDFSLQTFVRNAVGAGLIGAHLLNEPTAGELFANWNAPTDVR